MVSENFPKMNEEMNVYIKKTHCRPRKIDSNWGKETWKKLKDYSAQTTLEKKIK